MKPLKKPNYIMKDDGRVHPLWATLFLFVGIFLLSGFADALVQLILFSLFPALENTAHLPDLFGRLGTIGVVLLFNFWLEKHSASALSLRLSKNTGFFGEYTVGLLFGAILFSLIVLFCLLTNAITLSIVTEPISVRMLLLFFFGYMLQGFSEELMCRGYFLSALMRSVSLPWAVLLSSVSFSLLHIFNNGFNFLAFVNITLFGVFCALLTLRRGSLWAVAGLHTAWNFVQGNLFGICVSGGQTDSGFFTAALPVEKAFFNGGAFGLEGGICTTVVLAAGIAYALFCMEQKDK